MRETPIDAHAAASRVPGWALFGLAGWTAYVRGTRISNALGDDALSAGGRAFAIGMSVALLALGAVAVVARLRRSNPDRTADRLAAVFAAASVAEWLVRVPLIWLADHEVGFKVVHTMLAVVTWVLAAFVLRGARAAFGRAGASSGEPLDPAGVSPAPAGHR